MGTHRKPGPRVPAAHIDADVPTEVSNVEVGKTVVAGECPSARNGSEPRPRVPTRYVDPGVRPIVIIPFDSKPVSDILRRQTRALGRGAVGGLVG